MYEALPEEERLLFLDEDAEGSLLARSWERVLCAEFDIDPESYDSAFLRYSDCLRECTRQDVIGILRNICEMSLGIVEGKW